MVANDRQVGGSHYKKGGEEHWDRAWRLKYDPFQYIITKWIERWRDKGGIEDLEKARHALDKYIEVVKADRDNEAKAEAQRVGISNPMQGMPTDGSAPGSGYVGQDTLRKEFLRDQLAPTRR